MSRIKLLIFLTSLCDTVPSPLNAVTPMKDDQNR
jgi:hypothetical protein